jgi:hypothetical protein
MAATANRIFDTHPEGAGCSSVAAVIGGEPSLLQIEVEAAACPVANESGSSLLVSPGGAVTGGRGEMAAVSTVQCQLRPVGPSAVRCLAIGRETPRPAEVALHSSETPIPVKTS